MKLILHRSLNESMIRATSTRELLDLGHGEGLSREASQWQPSLVVRVRWPKMGSEMASVTHLLIRRRFAIPLANAKSDPDLRS